MESANSASVGWDLFHRMTCCESDGLGWYRHTTWSAGVGFDSDCRMDCRYMTWSWRKGWAAVGRDSVASSGDSDRPAVAPGVTWRAWEPTAEDMSQAEVSAVVEEMCGVTH